jgi:hypothetical protein
MNIKELNLPLLDKETLIKLLVSIDSQNSRLFETVENLRIDNRELKNTVANIKEYVADSYGMKILHAQKILKGASYSKRNQNLKPFMSVWITIGMRENTKRHTLTVIIFIT